MVEGSAGDNDSSTGTYTDDGSGATSTKTQNQFSFDIPQYRGQLNPATTHTIQSANRLDQRKM